MKMKSLIYKALSVSNDINAISKGKYTKRIIRKSAIKKSSNLITKLFK